ncbi:MAG: hypothetical protein FIA94_02420 [Nitrospirae bacterium]|nr:hypothetical protein [Nitrospirota bacterium]
MQKMLIVLAVIVSLIMQGAGPGYAAEGGHDHHDHEAHQHASSPAGPEPVVDLETAPAVIVAGKPAMITFTIRDDNNNPIKDLVITHDRLIHVVIISEDLSVFGHIHAEDIGPITAEMKDHARFPVRFTFPKAGKYTLAVDFAVRDRGYSELLDLEVSGSPLMGSVHRDLSREKDFDGYKVNLVLSPEQPVAGKETVLRYTIMKDGKPVADIEPYLAAAMHLAVINEGAGNYFVHAHGDRPGAMQHTGHAGHMTSHMGHSSPSGTVYGPEIEAHVVFPAKGTYKVFSEIRHQDKVRLFDFMVNVQ